MMYKTRRAEKLRYSREIITFLCTILLLLLLETGCDGTPQTSPPSGNTTSQNPSPTATQHPTPDATLKPTALHGPTNFLLNTPLTFSNVSGTTVDNHGTKTDLKAEMVKTAVNTTLAHLLFVVDSRNTVSVYIPGTTKPVRAQVIQNPDGSTAIDYSRTINSKKSTIAIAFDAALYNNDIEGSYHQQYSPTLGSSELSSDIAVTFTTHVKWVTANQIPLPPINGRFRAIGNTAITIAWDAGRHARQYAIYRLLPDRDQQFQFIATSTETMYTDTTAEAVQAAHTGPGIAYAVFSVGPDDVQNPGALTIPVRL